MTVKDSEHQLNLEISENENRKEFTFSERVDWAKRLERIEKLKAKERQGTRTDLNATDCKCDLCGRQVKITGITEECYIGYCDICDKSTFFDRNDDNIPQKSVECEKGETRNKVAAESGFGSHDTFSKAKYIAENADEEMIRELDEGKLSINKAYITLKKTN